LFGYIESLSNKLKEAEDELRDKRDVVRLTRNQVEEAEKHVQKCQNEKVGICVTQSYDCHLVD